MESKDPDVGDRIELASLPPEVDYGLRPGQQGTVIGLCPNYCVWVKFDRFNPAKQPSTKWGFALYFDEVRVV